MDFLIDLVPALPFLLVAFGLADIFLATKLAMGAAVLQIAASRWRYGKIKKMHAFTFAAIIIFGSITLFLHDEMFIKLKPTVLNWGFALVFLGAAVVFKRNILKMMLGEKLVMPDFAWSRLNLMWVVFFLVCAVLNLYVAFNYSTDDWVNFKLFGGMGLMLVFVIGQAMFLAKYMQQEEPK